MVGNHPSYAFFNASMSNFFIVSIAAMARFAFSGSRSCSITEPAGRPEAFELASS